MALVFGTSVALAQTTPDEHASHHPAGAPPPGAAAAQPSAPGMGMGPSAMPRMQDNMKKMQDLMAKIHASNDVAERRQLLEQHSKAMQEQMEMMHGMGRGAGGMQGASPTDEGMMKKMMMNHQSMQDRMDMMEQMMGQMLQHQDAQQHAKPAR